MQKTRNFALEKQNEATSMRKNPHEDFTKSTRGFRQIHTRISANPHVMLTNYTRVVDELYTSSWRFIHAYEHKKHNHAVKNI